MKKRVGWLMLLAAAVACGGQAAPPTVVVEIPTAVPAAGTPDGTGGGGEAAFVLLADYAPDPPLISVVDPATGVEQSSFSAPGLGELSSPRVGGPFLFYLDQSSQLVKRVGFDGAVTELRFITSGTDYFQGDYRPSPDGAMIVWGTSVFAPGAGNATQVTLKVANVDGSDERTILDETLQDVSILPQPFQWSPDGKYLYYTDEPYGIGGYILFWGGPDLKRVDAAAGGVTQILPDTGCLCAMAVSPDGATAAYITGSGPLELALYDIAAGNERRAPIDAGYLQAGDIVWSPDGRALVYTMAISNFENPDAERYAVVRVDVDVLSQTLLIPDDDRLLRTAAWPVAGAVWLNDKNGNSWRMNPATGDLVGQSEGQVVR